LLQKAHAAAVAVAEEEERALVSAPAVAARVECLEAVALAQAALAPAAEEVRELLAKGAAFGKAARADQEALEAV
jgi:hypothetical protein